mgnify:CR=1 FL=1
MVVSSLSGATTTAFDIAERSYLAGLVTKTNKVGAVLGTEMGAKAAPDGYTLTMAVSSAFGINPTLYSKLPYDAINDFAPITILMKAPSLLSVHPASGIASLQELIAAAKKRPGELNYATGSTGASNHIRMSLSTERSAILMRKQAMSRSCGIESK